MRVYGNDTESHPQIRRPKVETFKEDMRRHDQVRAGTWTIDWHRIQRNADDGETPPAGVSLLSFYRRLTDRSALLIDSYPPQHGRSPSFFRHYQTLLRVFYFWI
jgi:hypothetical protein